MNLKPLSTKLSFNRSSPGFQVPSNLSIVTADIFILSDESILENEIVTILTFLETFWRTKEKQNNWERFMKNCLGHIYLSLIM